MTSSTQEPQAQAQVQSIVPLDKPWFTLKNAKKVAIISLKVAVLGALLFYQPPLFVAGFAVGFIAKCIASEACSEAANKIQAAIEKRPGLFAVAVIAGTIICPEWLLVGPALMGGFYAGAKLAKLAQKG
jgi:hypothetical protein